MIYSRSSVKMDVPLRLYPGPQVVHGCLGEKPLESIPEFAQFIITVHSNTKSKRVTITAVKLASAAGMLENHSSQEMAS